MAKKNPFGASSFTFIVITVFLAVIGFGVVLPVIPFMVSKYFNATNTSAIAFAVGMLASAYAFCQFFAAPVLGALSDKYGRRPILLFCQLGSAIGYVLFGLGGSLFMLFLGRIIDGLTGGDIGTIMAYIADVTKPEERGKKFGIIGAVIGLGFMIGPSIGGLLSTINMSLPFYAAAVVTIINMLFGYFVLPESLDKEHRAEHFTAKHLNPFAQLQVALKKQDLRIVFLIALFYFLPFAQLQGIASLYFKDALNWGPAQIGFIFLVIGIGDMFTQGFLSGKLIPKLGEFKMLAIGLILTGIAYGIYAALVVFHAPAVLFAGVVLYALGSGFFEPSIGSVISRTAEPREQGVVQGANQSLQSLTRIVGPLTAAMLYRIGIATPYMVNVVISFAGVAVLLVMRKYVQHLSTK